MDASGDLLFVANRDNDNVVLFKRNKETGQLTFTSKEISIPTPVCVRPYILKYLLDFDISLRFGTNSAPLIYNWWGIVVFAHMLWTHNQTQ
jgi:hypothetical protein